MDNTEATPTMRIFLTRLGVHRRVLHALILRELMTRFGRHSLGFFWVVGEPLILSLCVMAAWTAAQHKLEDDVGIIPFVLSGYVMLTMWRHIVGRSQHCFREYSGLMFHRNISYVDAVIARSLLEIGGTGIAFWVAYVPFYLVGVIDPIYDPSLIIGGWLLLGWFSFAVGLLIAALTELNEIVEKFIQPFMYVTLPLTGMFSMISWLPDRMGRVLAYSPTANCFEMFREGLFGHKVDAYWDAVYTAKCCLVLTALGLLLAQRARYYVRSE